MLRGTLKHCTQVEVANFGGGHGEVADLRQVI